MKNIKLKDVFHLYMNSKLEYYENDKFICYVDFKDSIAICEELYKNIKPVLKPLSTFTIEEFAEICKIILNTDKVIYDIVNGYFAVTTDFDDDIDELDEDYRNDYAERILNADSNDNDSVLSMHKPTNNYSSFDLAFGIDSEMRFFVGVGMQGIFVSELCKRGFDIFDLISSSQAIELGKEVASESK